MRLFRIGLPALTGLLILFISAQSIRVNLGAVDGSVVETARTWLLPIAGGIGLLLAALAISRRSRIGYLSGIAIAILMVLAGVAIIVLQLPYLAAGGLSAAFGAGAVVLAVAWIVVWAAHGLSMRHARPSFATTWQPLDRRFGIVLAGLAIFASAAYVSLGVVSADQAANGNLNAATAEALVAGTSLDAKVVSATYGTSASPISTTPVATLTLDVSFTSPSAYALAGLPTLCLVDAATAADPAFKPDTYCWGGPGHAIVLADGFRDLTIPTSTKRIRLELDRGDSLCAFGPGTWAAQVRLEPVVGDAASGAEAYTQTATFTVETATAPSSGGTATVGTCLGTLVSP